MWLFFLWHGGAAKRAALPTRCCHDFHKNVIPRSAATWESVFPVGGCGVCRRRKGNLFFGVCVFFLQLLFHFFGNSSHDYTEHLYEQNGLLFSGDQIPLLQVNFNNILSSAQHAIVNEPQISLNVDKLLSTLAAPESSSALANQILSPALEHIRKGFAEPLNLDELAGLCSISTSYFIRCFKKYLNCTPHEYLLLYRLRQAKNLLLSTPDSVEGIADTCGFNSPSHFARAFKKVNQMTPSEFRALHF